MEYLHGGDIYRNPVEYDFSVNINPLGMPEGSIKAAKKGIILAGSYPDYRGEALCRKLAKVEEISEEAVLLGNGAAELIYALCYALKPKKALLLAPSFQEYEAAVLAAGGETVFWGLQEKEDFFLQEDFLSAITEEISLLFLCNPNNPTGSLIDRQFLKKIAARCEETGTYFCLDECFLPFLEEEAEFTMKKELEDFPHLMILRAFTKIYGMPGLRLGYGLSANKGLLGKMRSTLQPWNTSLPAQLAGLAALEDKVYLVRTRKLISAERSYLTAELMNAEKRAGKLEKTRQLAKKVYSSAANYIFFQAEKDLKERLLKEKILIRSCANYRGLAEGYYRISIRTHEENQELIRRWRESKWQKQS